jgi:hypothetical protein
METTSLKERCDVIEECYEFLLAYAAQGLVSDEGSDSGLQARRLLGRADEALDGIADAYRAAAREAGLQPAADYEAFLSVLERDASNSRAAIRLVVAQPALSSQLIDNLNASIHVRAMLTDLFLIDEVYKTQKLLPV